MPPFGSLRAPAVARLAILTAISAGVVGCSSDISRFQNTSFSGPVARNNAPSPDHTGSITPAPMGRVESQPLQGAPVPPPPPVVYGNSGGYQSSPSPAQRVSQAPVQQPSRAQPSATHVVAPGETLISISRRYGQTRTDVARANGIAPDTSVRIGQRLTIPGAGQAQMRTASVAPASPAGSPRVLGAPPSNLRAPEGAARPVAQQPMAPVAAAPLAQPAVTTAKLSPTPTVPAGRFNQTKTASAEPVATARLASPTSVPDAAAADSAPSATGATPSFRWPVRGRVIAGFGAKTNGQQNDGINLAVPEGTSVRAAEDGVVAYSGSELKGFGNLVLVRHSNGYVTAYAHASELKVKRGETVKRGQIIALAGQTGSVTSPQLHFEVRKGSNPVDPTQYLASN